MDNLSSAIYMAFASFTLVLAIAVSLMLFRKVDETAKVVMQVNNKNKYMQKIDMDMLFSKNSNDIPKLLTTRIVSKEAIIPVLYRYMIESLTIKIYDKTDNPDSPINMQEDLNQIFFHAYEESFKRNKEKIGKEGTTNFDKEYIKIFDKNKDGAEPPAYLYNVPWEHDNSLAQQRVEYYIHGLKGFIKGVEVDYKNSTIAKDDGTGKYKEIVIEYPYNGEVTQELEYVENQVYLQNEVIKSRVKEKNTEIIYIKIK